MPSHRERFLAACVQMRAGDDKAENLARAVSSIEAASRLGARLVVLPEVFAWRGPSAGDAEAAEPLDGPTIGTLADLASRLRLTIVGGSILERSEEPGALPWNTSVAIGEDGSILGAYRKVHLFDVSIPGKVETRESARRTPGDAPLCVDSEVARLGLSVCYDLRFPELYRAYRDAVLIVVPSAFTAVTGAAHWHILLKARAIENQCYVLAAAQGGVHANGRRTYGHSVLIDPWGSIVDELEEGPGVVVGDIDPDRIAQVRSDLPALAHRRLG